MDDGPAVAAGIIAAGLAGSETAMAIAVLTGRLDFGGHDDVRTAGFESQVDRHINYGVLFTSPALPNLAPRPRWRAVRVIGSVASGMPATRHP